MFLPKLIGQGEKCRVERVEGISDGSQMGRDETRRQLVASWCQG